MLVDFNLIISLFAIYRYIKSTHYAPNFIQHYVSTIVDPGTTGSWVADTHPPTHNVHTAISASKTKELMNASTQRQEAETFWMDSKLKPGFFWFHVLWSLTEHKLSPTLNFKICTMKIWILYLLGGEKSTYKWTHAVQTHVQGPVVYQ